MYILNLIIAGTTTPPRATQSCSTPYTMHQFYTQDLSYLQITLPSSSILYNRRVYHHQSQLPIPTYRPQNILDPNLANTYTNSHTTSLSIPFSVDTYPLPRTKRSSKSFPLPTHASPNYTISSRCTSVLAYPYI